MRSSHCDISRSSWAVRSRHKDGCDVRPAGSLLVRVRWRLDSGHLVSQEAGAASTTNERLQLHLDSWTCTVDYTPDM